jgi:hypothetical protein
MFVKSAKSFILLVLLITTHQGFTQFPRMADLAVIENDSLHNHKLLERLAELQNQGYEICTLNSPRLTLTTNSYFIENMPLLVYYQITVWERYALLRGYIMDLREISYSDEGIPTGKWFRSAFRPVPGGVRRTGFQELILIAEKLRTGFKGKVTWLKEESI